MDQIRSEYVLEDLGDLCVFPGLVDLNVEFNGEPTDKVTMAAVMGGVTTVATHQAVCSASYTDIAPLGVLCDEGLGSVERLRQEGVFGLRTFLVSQDSSHGHLKDLSEGLAEATACGLPVFLHPEYMSEKSLATTSPCRELDTAQRQAGSPALKQLQNVPELSAFDDDSDNDAEAEEVLLTYDKLLRAPKSLYHTPISRNEGVIRRTSLKAPSFVKPFDACEEGQDAEGRLQGRKQRVSLPSIFTGLSLHGKSKRFAGVFKSELTRYKKTGAKEVMKRGSWMSSSSESIDEESEKQFVDDGNLLEEAKSDYIKHLQAHPEDLEIDAVLQAVAAVAQVPTACVHISALGSSRAVGILQNVSAEIRQKITLSTATAYLHFTDSDVKPGDTRYKCNPPIRDQGNQSRLWDLLQQGNIDSVTTYHQPHSTGAKLLGSFTRAKNGITSIGLGLQILWTGLRKELKEEEVGAGLMRLAQWLATAPANTLGLGAVKGSLKPGKHADFLVWDPRAVTPVPHLPYQYPEMCPYYGQVLAGQIYRTYLRGALVYSADTCSATGVVLSRQQLA